MLADYLQILWRRKWLIAFAVLVTVGVVMLRTAMLPRVYTATTTLRVLTASIGSPDFVQYDVTYADRLMNTYARIARSQPVMDQLQSQLNLSAPPSLSVDVIPLTELMQLSAQDQDPSQAAAIANALGRLLITNIESTSQSSAKTASDLLDEQLTQVQTELTEARQQYSDLSETYPAGDTRLTALENSIQLKEQIYGTLLDQYEAALASEAVRTNTLSVVEPAGVPTSPSSPNVVLNAALGLVVGLAAGLALAFSLENLDTTLHTSKQIERVLKLRTLGRIPAAKSMALDSDEVNEAFRALRTNLLNAAKDSPLRTLLVTSAEPGEGKSTTVAHLAQALAQAGSSVVVVDCDLRRPRLHKIFSCSNEVGLTDLLARRIEPSQAVQKDCLPNVLIIASGVLAGDEHPAELLASDNMSRLLERLAQLYDFVLLDAPAARAVVDATILASLADGVLLVVGRGATKADDLRETYDQLVDANAHIFGMAINRAEGSAGYRYYVHKAVRA